MAADCTFGFEKVFVVDDFMATGMLFLLVGGTKPKKNSKDNYYVSKGIIVWKTSDHDADIYSAGRVHPCGRA